VDDQILWRLKRRGVKVTKRIIKEAMKDRVIQKRLLGDLDVITSHLDAMTTMQSRNGKVCRWCSVVAFTYCSKCSDKPALHFYTTKGASKGKGCALHYHNTNFFGLAKADAVGISLPIKQWREPSKRHYIQTIWELYVKKYVMRTRLRRRQVEVACMLMSRSLNAMVGIRSSSSYSCTARSIGSS
jgi:hypothetical protein